MRAHDDGTAGALVAVLVGSAIGQAVGLLLILAYHRLF